MTSGLFSEIRDRDLTDAVVAATNTFLHERAQVQRNRQANPEHPDRVEFDESEQRAAQQILIELFHEELAHPTIDTPPEVAAMRAALHDLRWSPVPIAPRGAELVAVAAETVVEVMVADLAGEIASRQLVDGEDLRESIADWRHFLYDEKFEGFGGERQPQSLFPELVEAWLSPMEHDRGRTLLD